MKLQYLAIIFLIIILPIVLVLTVYVDYHIDAINQKHAYDTKLLNSTYDAIKSYQLNTVNNAISDISASKIGELEAAVKTFYNSLSNTFGYTGYKSSVMEEYVPAVVFTMYDGYYIYSPYRNVLTGVPSDEVDDNYEDNKILEGIKPYVYYSCRYKNESGTEDKKFDIVITYTLDNYITIQGYVYCDENNNGTKEKTYVNKHGYLIDGIEKVNNTTYKYDNIEFKENSTECLKEYLGAIEYPYAKINGTKYYLDESKEEVFYINSTGKKSIQAKKEQNLREYKKYKNFITKNDSAYKYYKDAYEFTKWVREHLSNLKTTHAVDTDGNEITDFADYIIFGADSNPGDKKTSGPDANKYIQDLNSDFEVHRSAVIRYTIEKNLSAAIAGYNNYFENSECDFIMPNISETDWEVIQNNISMIAFLQGFTIAGRDYNEYCVVGNNLTKEYVDENDIYILGNNNTYYKVNDKELIEEIDNGTITIDNSNYASGVWDLNCERRIDATGEDEKIYYPLSYNTNKPYLGSYSSIISSTSVDNNEVDLYKYLRNGRDTDSDGVPDTEINDDLKEAYYTALGRERYGRYSSNNSIDLLENRKWRYKTTYGKRTDITNGEIVIPIGAYVNYEPNNSAVSSSKKKYTSDKGTNPAQNSIVDVTNTTQVQGNGDEEVTFSVNEYSGKWKVLGVDESTGEVLIISADLVKEKYELRGFTGARYGEKELNNACAIYGHGKGATGARSINVDDVNSLTGYNPNHIGQYDPEKNLSEGTKCWNNLIYKYGNEVTYKWTSTANLVTIHGLSNTEKLRNEFYYWENNKWNKSIQNTSSPTRITTLKSTLYLYYPETLKEDLSGTNVGITKTDSVTKHVYNTLFYNNQKTSKIAYWLASTAVQTPGYGILYDMFYVDDDSDDNKGNIDKSYVSGYCLYRSDGTVYGSEIGVRPVVSLYSDIELEYNASENIYKIIE